MLRAADGEKQLEDWINESKEKSPPSKIEDYFENHRNAAGKYSPYPGPFPTKDGGLEHGSPGLPADVKTDQDGRFQLSGLGPNRLAVLELEGPAIAKCFVHVVTREIETVYAQPPENEGLRAGTYFGRDFQFVAEPTQSIEGTVTDIETGKPLAHLEVCLGQFAENTFLQRDFLVPKRTTMDITY